ncbi:PRC-barrel domain-containing protein [Fimbriiglobus ruber]|uniref:PRC-barrel domain-containing protein n=1 Tax=Fimbriiglobus ruber TaxID=1908690 RepID=A0A225DAV3_9BACT|nr:PRC-barrel domain-containing protein [Fimbriiglobus ruber]OWK36784.1 hypothetical protein FRUB_09347 [Fimbriiglobus ruber]
MLKTILRVGSTFVACAALAVPVLAQAPVPQPAPGTPVQPNAEPQAYRAKQVLGSKVNLQNSTSVGTVEDIVFDQNGTIEYLIVENEGKMVTAPWTAATFNPQLRTAVINITPQQYQAIPTFTTTTYPNFYAPTYRTQVYGYYGLTPGQLRRAERRGVIQP